MTWIATIRAGRDAVRVHLDAPDLLAATSTINIFGAGWIAGGNPPITIEAIAKASRVRNALHIFDETRAVGDALRTKSS